jgi:hypothetical protein
MFGPIADANKFSGRCKDIPPVLPARKAVVDDHIQHYVINIQAVD